MKLTDRPTPECDLADDFLGVRKHYTDTAVARSLEQRLAHAVEALEEAIGCIPEDNKGKDKARKSLSEIDAAK